MQKWHTTKISTQSNLKTIWQTDFWDFGEVWLLWITAHSVYFFGYFSGTFCPNSIEHIKRLCMLVSITTFTTAPGIECQTITIESFSRLSSQCACVLHLPCVKLSPPQNPVVGYFVVYYALSLDTHSAESHRWNRTRNYRHNYDRFMWTKRTDGGWGGRGRSEDSTESESRKGLGIGGSK